MAHSEGGRNELSFPYFLRCSRAHCKAEKFNVEKPINLFLNHISGYHDTSNIFSQSNDSEQVNVVINAWIGGNNAVILSLIRV